MGYSDILKERRQSRDMTQKAVAQKLNFSIMTVSNAERPYIDTNQLPSEEYIKAFVDYFGTNDLDKEELFRKLMIERALIKLPDIVAKQFKECLNNQYIARSGAMPPSFRELINTDWTMARKKNLKKFTAKDINDIINGTLLISRDDIILLAEELKKDRNKYLLTAGYLSEDMLELYNRINISTDLIARLLKLPENELSMFVEFFKNTLELYEKYYVKKNKKTRSNQED